MCEEGRAAVINKSALDPKRSWDPTHISLPIVILPCLFFSPSRFVLGPSTHDLQVVTPESESDDLHVGKLEYEFHGGELEVVRPASYELYEH